MDKNIEKKENKSKNKFASGRSVSDKSLDRQGIRNIGRKKNVDKNGGQGERKNRKADALVNEHYLAIAFRFKAARLLLLLAMFIFIAITALFNSKELTTDNFYYLLRYIDIQSSAKTETSGFSIDIDEESQIGYYKNNIVVLKKNKIDIYDLNGRKNFSHQLAYSTPVLEVSDKYILTYDSGINKLQIFNSFSRLYEYKNEYNETRPVYSAKITDKGNIVYITSEKGYKFAVKVMNKDFREIYECYFGEKYIIAADIDNDAKKLAVAGFRVQDGDYQGELLLYDTNNDYNAGSNETYRKRILVQGEIPLGLKFNDSGFFAICENSLKAYDKEYENILDYNFGYRAIEAFEFTDEIAAVVLNEKKLRNENSILIFDCNGNTVYSEILNTDIIDIKFSENVDALYFLTRQGLYKIDIEKGIYELVTENYDETSHEIIYADDKNIFISGLTKVDIIKIEE